MSQQEKADPIMRLEAGESPNGNLSKLAELARQAYERRGTKECLDLTRAMLLIDPDNADALRMRSSIQSDLHRDLENARSFLRQVHSKEEVAKTAQQVETQAPSVPQLDPIASDRDPSDFEVPLPPESDAKRRTSWLVAATAFVLLAAVAASLSMLMSRWNPVEGSLSKLNASDRSSRYLSAGQPDASLSQADQSTASPLMSILVPTSAPMPVAVRAPASHRAEQVPDAPVTPAANGTLAISSPTSVDIYRDDAYLGSVPISLELPPGTLTLEYRHGGLRKDVTHVISSNETTKVMITFDVSVQINSKPWAEVYMDGVERKDLGQTPLGSVRVPIGGVLVFENPKYPAKKYRVTGKETGIQIVFP